jgi:nucleotide-binding universal stress UspA family protein
LTVVFSKENGMFNRIIVPLDGSPLAEAALPTAVQLGREIILLRVHQHQDVLVTASIGGDMPLFLSSMEEEFTATAVRYLHEIAQRWSWPNVQIRTQVEVGVPAELIVATAVAEEADLIMMTTHGRTGLRRFVMGSVAEEVLQHSPCPVLILRHNQPLANILLLLDGSALSERAVTAAARVARATGGQITLLRVQPPISSVEEEELGLHLRLEYGLEKSPEEALLICVDEYLQTIRESEALQGLPTQLVSRIGQPAEEILNYSREHHTDLIVMSTHGRTGLARWVYGSVAKSVLHGTETAVLIVRPEEMHP